MQPIEKEQIISSVWRSILVFIAIILIIAVVCLLFVILGVLFFS